MLHLLQRRGAHAPQQVLARERGAVQRTPREQEMRFARSHATSFGGNPVAQRDVTLQAGQTSAQQAQPGLDRSQESPRSSPLPHPSPLGGGPGWGQIARTKPLAPLQVAGERPPPLTQFTPPPPPPRGGGAGGGGRSRAPNPSQTNPLAQPAPGVNRFNHSEASSSAAPRPGLPRGSTPAQGWPGFSSTRGPPPPVW